ncbi:unnamed protein product [Paramecium sonneborni]|uniref:Uncharacterized protein n=1 Tax=Paramecium sonneborni TaxID=65129 RepID=A0A8S1RQ57_9CILI|nr:unnamed protein product [Paramecium sonneborni]
MSFYSKGINSSKDSKNCFDYIIQYSSQIAYPNLDLNYEVWRIKA